MYIRLLLIASIALMANQIILAQSLKIEYPEYTTDIAIQGNTLWQATSNSLYKSDLVTGQMLKEISYPLGYNNPFGMTTDHNNNLWFFSPYYGVARYDRQGNWQVWDSLNTPIFKGFFLNNIAFDPSSNRIFLLAQPQLNLNIAVKKSLGTSLLAADLAFELWPNPVFDGQINIDAPAAGILNVKNIQGQIVYSQKIASGISRFSMNESTPGIYFIELQTAEGRGTKKIVVGQKP